MNNNYDPIASHYDRLSRIIFRRNLILSQTCLLQHIPSNSSILIVGGGTGWILSELAKTHTSGLRITYVEISEKMINLAKKHNTGKNSIEFVNLAIEDYDTNQTFDIIITAFLFDNFGEEKVKLVFDKLSQLLTVHGKWLFADFHIDEKKSHWWQRVLLKAMLYFFRVICHIESRHLVPVKTLFAQNKFRGMYVYQRMYGFIKSYVYVRISPE
jgi:ubiquinone/menaquinone biosynthesis C-methylase UbiE